jgi:hypothetical protein
MRGRLCKVVVQAENKFGAFRAFPLVLLHFWVSLGRSGRRIGSQERPKHTTKLIYPWMIHLDDNYALPEIIKFG